MFYFFIFFTSLVLTAGITVLVRKAAISLNILDQPDEGGHGRKIHRQPIPLLGGMAIFLAYFILLFIFARHFLSGNLRWSHLLAFFIGALILVIGGALDDKYNLPPRKQIIFPLLAIAVVILGGVEIEKITNPFTGGYIDLNSLAIISPLLIAFWLLGMMYTTKLLDGVDGLVTGITAIGGFVIFLFTTTTRYFQPDIAFASILLTGTALGFLIFNWHPAKIFLGEGGSLLLGYILGVLAIISGGKIAIALLIMGIPILDVFWTILRRLINKQNPFKSADKKHLHHRLLDLGLGQRGTVLLFYFLALSFGLSGLFLQSRGKFLALILLVVIMFGLVVTFWFMDRKNKKPSLLLHVCCAPCASYISRDILLPQYKLTWYFDNPNLNSLEEYNKRLAAVKFVATKLAIPLIVEPYKHEAWLEKVKGRETDPERGKRCHLCYRDRLSRTALLAQKKKFTYFSTSLLLSPYKDTEAIKKISLSLTAENGPKFLDIDFQANNGYQRSQELAKELGLYRQKFCGCEFSLDN
ncbi:hypothetical protein GX917_01175 [Candidatus Falkowbacteria bacterium]|jgi:UDP-GlcNAc:undecaprenyl-phosphate GlcNAc-1-phosphate transferase|nr:hypothetical protein [Candidatus Falkowbacteria bacterium]